jgi:hypothetical protein
MPRASKIEKNAHTDPLGPATMADVKRSPGAVGSRSRRLPINMRPLSPVVLWGQAIASLWRASEPRECAGVTPAPATPLIQEIQLSLDIGNACA